MTAAPPLASRIDHLVVAAVSLAEGVEWCEKKLGVTPGPGGEHPLMGTHNRLFLIASSTFPRAYLEIIAIHSGASYARSAWARRWFDLDDPELQAQLAKSGPRLVHFVARTALADERRTRTGQTGARSWRGIGRIAPHSARRTQLENHSAARRPAPFLRRAADADRMGAGTPGARHACVRRGATVLECASPSRRSIARRLRRHRVARCGGHDGLTQPHRHAANTAGVGHA